MALAVAPFHLSWQMEDLARGLAWGLAPAQALGAATVAQLGVWQAQLPLHQASAWDTDCAA